ncbi:MAG: EipA family protein [Parvularcula sp.]|jgi:hypothetical protein|nr:EipA family protein [Parvularcula sp.]
MSLKTTTVLAMGALGIALVGCTSTNNSNAGYDDIDRMEAERDLSYPVYQQDTILDEAENAFGQASAEIAEVINDVFARQGQPQAYIAGEEVGGAIGVGVTYGRGMLYRPNQQPVEVFWQGPSIGFDVGGDASKVFTLVYDLGATENIYRRYPGGGGNIFFIGGAGAEAMTQDGVTIVPIRTGVGARSGVSVEYMKFTKTRDVNPF